MPGADPGEGFHNTNYQLFSTDQPTNGAIPENKGFLLNFKASIASDLAKHYKDTLPGTDSFQIMGMYAPELLPIMSGLAKGFAVCDQWFSSAPTQRSQTERSRPPEHPRDTSTTRQGFHLPQYFRLDVRK